MTVFVSYCQRDEAYARELSLALIEANVKVWRDEYRLRPGDTLQESLLAAVRTSKLFVVLLSDASAESEWVKLETAYAIEREARGLIEIVPVRLDTGRVLASVADRLFLDGAAGAAAIAQSITRRALDAASPPAAGQRVSDDARCFTHHALESGLDDEKRPWLRLDVVSFDLDCPYSILSEFAFTSAEPLADASDADVRAIGTAVLEACAASARADPWRVKLRRGDAARGAFKIDAGCALFHATYRIARIGEVGRGVVVFNAGALFELVTEANPEGSAPS